VRNLVYSIKISVVTTNSPEGTCFSALLSPTYIRESTSDITTLPLMCSHIIFQEVGCFENSTPLLVLQNTRPHFHVLLHWWATLRADWWHGYEIPALSWHVTSLRTTLRRGPTNRCAGSVTLMTFLSSRRREQRNRRDFWSSEWPLQEYTDVHLPFLDIDIY